MYQHWSGHLWFGLAKPLRNVCFLRIHALVVVDAVANSLASVAAASGNRRGCTTDGLDGHLMMTAAGLSSASTSSTVTASWPLSCYCAAR